MAQLEFNDERIEAKAGETLVQAARRHGSYVWFLCDGRGSRQTCECRVISGDENVRKYPSWSVPVWERNAGEKVTVWGARRDWSVRGQCRSSTELSTTTAKLIAAAFVKQSWLAVTLLCVCVGCLRLTVGSVNSVPFDLAPVSADSSLTSIQNFFGNIGGLLAPIVTGYFVSSTGSFVGSLVVAGGMALFGPVSCVFLMGNLETARLGPEDVAPEIPVFHSMKLRNR